MRKIFVIIITALVFLLPLSAQDYSDYDEIISELSEYVPPEVGDSLPKEINGDSVNDLVSVFSVKNILKKSVELIKYVAPDIIKMISLFICAIVLSSLISLLKSSLKSNTAEAVEYAAAIVTVLIIAKPSYEILENCSEYLKSLSVFMNASLPYIGLLYSSGGNVAAAAVNNITMSFFLVINENLIAYALAPIIKTVTFLTILSILSPSVNIDGVIKFIKGIFSALMVFVISLFSIVLGCQSSLASAADTVGSKTLKFAAGSMIPIVGGALSDAMKTVGAGLSLAKNVVGTFGIAAVILMFLPYLISLFAYRGVFHICEVGAGMLSCTREEKFLKEFKGLCDFAIAILSSVSVIFILNLTLLLKTASAIGA